MSDALSARQTHILKALIDEYIETAEPVGSESLEKRYNLGVSPATIRNEMSYLTKTGYLRQPHTSAGRVPSPKAVKFYIDQLMEERQMSVAEEVKAKEEVWDLRADLDDVLEEATHTLAHMTNSMAVAVVTPDKKVWHWGHSSMLANPEFFDLRSTASMFACLEQAERLHELFFEHMTGNTPVEVIFGEELGWPGFSPVGVVGTRFEVGGRSVGIGIIGPIRLEYPKVIPTIRYFRNLIGDIIVR
jgi:transcriptional regulator of heat shock response